MTQHPDRAEMIERLTEQVRTEDGFLRALVHRRRYGTAESLEAVCAIALRESEAMVRDVLRKLEERERWLGVAGSAGNAIRAAIASRAARVNDSQVKNPAMDPVCIGDFVHAGHGVVAQVRTIAPELVEVDGRKEMQTIATAGHQGEFKFRVVPWPEEA